MDRMRLSCISALAIGTGAVIVFTRWWWSKEKKLRIPTKWREVGKLSDIFVFPVKSLGYIRETAVECTILGCKSGWLRDRTLMVTDHDGRFITARKIPRMVLVKPSIADSVLSLDAPGMMTIAIDLAYLGKNSTAIVWGQQVPARDCGEDVAQWLSRFLLQQDNGLRLVYYPLDTPCRDAKSRNKGFHMVETLDAGAFPDMTSFTMMNEASVADLNTRLEDQVTPLQFRMNFIVKGAEALEEDTWDWVKIGSVVFRNIRPCTRCILTTIDPEAGIKSTASEPLQTLKKYRQIDDPMIRSHVGESPALGIHLSLKGPTGFVRLDDPVYVGVSEDEEI